MSNTNKDPHQLQSPVSLEGSLHLSCPRENDSRYCLYHLTYLGTSLDQVTWSIRKSVYLITLREVSPSQYLQSAHLRLYYPHDIMDLLQKSPLHSLSVEIGISRQPHIIIWSISQSIPNCAKQVPHHMLCATHYICLSSTMNWLKVLSTNNHKRSIPLSIHHKIHQISHQGVTRLNMLNLLKIITVIYQRKISLDLSYTTRQRSSISTTEANSLSHPAISCSALRNKISMHDTKINRQVPTTSKRGWDPDHLLVKPKLIKYPHALGVYEVVLN